MAEEKPEKDPRLEQRIKKHISRFEPGLSPSSIHNRKAARARGLRYDCRRRVYVDSDGCPMRDRYGQQLG